MAETNPIYESTSVTGMLARAAHTRMLLISLACVVAGTGAAALRGNMELLPATLCLIFAVLSQLSGSFWYCYNDMKARHEDLDDDDAQSDIDSIPKATVLREAAIGLLIMDAIIGLALLTMAGFWVLLVGAAVAVTVFFAFAGPRPAIRTPWGVLTTFILFGPIAVIGTTLTQSGHEANRLLNFYDVSPALYIAVVMGLMAVNCNITHNIFHIEHDGSYGRNTLPMKGRKGLAKALFFGNGVVWTVVIALLCVAQNLPDWWMYMSVPAIVLAVNCRLGFLLDNPKADSGKMQLAVNLNMLVMAVAILITSLFIGAPDDSALTIF